MLVLACKMDFKKKIKVSIILLFSAFILSNVYAYSIPIKTLKLQEKDVVLKQSFLGVIKPLDTAVVQSQVAGQVEDIRVSVGDKVKKGEILLEVHNHTEQLRLVNAEANHGKVLADYRAEEFDFLRAAKLYNNKVISESKLRQEEAKFKSIKETLKIAKANLKEAKIRFDQTKVKSPMNGVIYQKKVGLNSLVDIGTLLMIISSADYLKVVVPVPLKYVKYLEKDMPVVVTDLNNDVTKTAKLTNISPIANNETKSVEVFVVFQNEKNWYLGSTVFVSFPLKKERVFIVPTESIVYKEGPPELYFIKNNKAHSIKIALIKIDKDQAWVKGKDLRSGMVVATKGAVNLSNNIDIVEIPSKSKQ